MKTFSAYFLFAFIMTLTPAFANVKPGTYTGTDKSGQICQFTLLQSRFESDLPHPLNERQPVESVKYGEFILPQAAWSLAHVQEVDAEFGTIGFVHSQFRQVVATKGGAIALVLIIDEKESPDGHQPKSLIYIENNYRNSRLNVRMECQLN